MELPPLPPPGPPPPGPILPPPGPPRPPLPPRVYVLREDCHSFFRKSTIYGRKNDVVTEVSVSDPVVIVEAKNGERYPIHKDKLIHL